MEEDEVLEKFLDYYNNQYGTKYKKEKKADTHYKEPDVDFICNDINADKRLAIEIFQILLVNDKKIAEIQRDIKDGKPINIDMPKLIDQQDSHKEFARQIEEAKNKFSKYLSDKYIRIIIVDLENSKNFPIKQGGNMFRIYGGGEIDDAYNELSQAKLFCEHVYKLISYGQFREFID